MKKIAKLLLIAGVASIALMCALSAFACMPPFWGAEEEMPEDLSNLYRGKTKKNSGRFKNMMMKGYQAKSFN